MAHQIEDKELEEEEEYDENADEDFNPDAPRENEDASSSDDEEESAPAAKPVPKGRKRKSAAVTEGDLDSGDEETIQARQKKRRKGATPAEDDESGGEGGLIRTRAQRLAEKLEQKQRKRVRDGDVTIDVDELWAELTAIPVGRSAPAPPKVHDASNVDVELDKENMPTESDEARDNAERMITIKRRIEYAGEVTEVEESVPRSSDEAQRYLAEHPEADPDYRSKNSAGQEIQRPLKRPSRFEPNALAIVKGVPSDRLRPRAPSRLDVLMAEQRAEEERKKRVEKLTTVQKSALDWRGFVDQEGLREELDEYGKSKHGFLAREEFLDRAQFARDIAAREARMKR